MEKIVCWFKQKGLEDSEDAGTPSTVGRRGSPRVSLRRTYHHKDADATFLTKLIYHLDMFGVQPLHTEEQARDQRRKHVCGFAASVIIFTILTLVATYTMAELLQCQYSQTTGRVADSPLISLGTTRPLCPEIWAKNL